MSVTYIVYIAVFVFAGRDVAAVRPIYMSHRYPTLELSCKLWIHKGNGGKL